MTANPPKGTSMRAQNLLIAATGMSIFLASVAWATPPTHNAMGATLKVISKGQTSTIEIRLKPRTSFDTVRVEAASGVGSLTPPCSFTAVVVGGSYACQVSVSHKTGEASLTLNVVGEKTVDPERPRLVEVSHFTLANPGFVATTTNHLEKRPSKPAPSLTLTPPQGTPK
jgi:hypothetical protein